MLITMLQQKQYFGARKSKSTVLMRKLKIVVSETGWETRMTLYYVTIIYSTTKLIWTILQVKLFNLQNAK